MSTGTPSVEVLIQSVADWIEEVRPTLAVPHAFLARVAGAALGVAAREIAEGPAAAAAERSRLADLLGHDGDSASLRLELSAAIRDGRMTDRSPGVLDALFLNTVEQLAIDQPGYRFEIDGLVRTADEARADRG